VKNPLRFTYDEIRALPPYETISLSNASLIPSEGRFIGNAKWTGTLLIADHRTRRVLPAAKYAVFYAAEGYTTGHPISRLDDPANFLAYHINGEPLPRQHGFPLRVLMPGRYGMKMPKWLTRIEFVDKEDLGYWNARAGRTPATARRRASSTIPAIFSNQRRHVRRHRLCHRRYFRHLKVEISTDGGSRWQEVEIFSNPNPSQVWALWKFVWKNAPKGKQTLKARATDGRGKLQSSVDSGEWPDGAPATTLSKSPSADRPALCAT